MAGSPAYGPGIVDMPMWDHIDREFAGIVGTLPSRAVCTTQLTCKVGGHIDRRGKSEVRGADIKLGHIQEPENVAKLVSFLVSAKGEYITSQTIKTCGCASL